MAAVAELSRDSFKVLEVRADAASLMRVRFRIAGEPGTFAVRLPLPSAKRLNPWLYAIPRDAADAASMLATFLEEEVETGCAGWGLTAAEGPDQVFTLETYGFRPSDETEHRRQVKSVGPDGYRGWIDHDEDEASAAGGRKLARLAASPFTYPEVGATAGALPAGYRHINLDRQLGSGAATFRVAAERLMSWDMHRRAGLLVDTIQPTVTLGSVAVLGIMLGPWRIDAPVRIVNIITEPSVQGFAYGTLPGHPESGEERFLVHHDADGTVRAEIRAFSRPARWFTRLGAPLARQVQDRTSGRYLAALNA